MRGIANAHRVFIDLDHGKTFVYIICVFNAQTYVCYTKPKKKYFWVPISISNAHFYSRGQRKEGAEQSACRKGKRNERNIFPTRRTTHHVVGTTDSGESRRKKLTKEERNMSGTM